MVAPAFSWDKFQKGSMAVDSPKNLSQENGHSQEKEITEESKQQYSWGNFQNTSTYQGEPDPTAEEGFFGTLARNLYSNVARGREAILGKFGDVEQLARKGIAKFPQITPISYVAEQMLGKEKWNDLVLGKNRDAGILATTQDLKKLEKKFTGEYTEPKTNAERIGQELSSDVGSLISGNPARSVARTLAVKIGIPAVATAAKESVKELGFGEDTQTWTKLATWTALSLAEGVNAPAYAARLMNEGRNGFNPRLGAIAPRYEHQLNRVSNRMLQGDPRSSLAQQQIAGIRTDIQNGQIGIRDLMNRYDAINAAKRDRGLFELGRADRRAAIRNINEVLGVVRQEIGIIGQTNPAALRSWEEGLRAFSVIHQSNAISNTAKRWLKGPYTKAAVFSLFGGAALKNAGTVGTAATVGAAANKVGQVAYRVWNDPVLARYYWNAINAARQENQTAFMKNFQDLDKEYNKKYKD